MQPSSRVFHPPSSHAAVRHAAGRLAGTGGVTEEITGAEAVVGTSGDLGLPALPERTFEIFFQDDRTWFTGDRPRTVLAGALYWLHHRGRGAAPALPLRRTSPFRHRLIMEDFPFKTYQPMGFEIDDELYAENVVGLGYTSIECNRISRREPIERWWDNFQTVDPSPSRFVWTKWHEGVFDPEIVAANAAELRKCIDLAVKFDLEPSVTMFLPRPYPERFFAKYPHLRGPFYEHGYFKLGNHRDQYSIDTDHPEGLAFYEALFTGLMDANPEIQNFCFWHGDLGANFWKDGEGPRKRQRMERILEFHQLLDRILTERRNDTQVWISPWAMPEHTLDEVNKALPARVGFSTKDNPAAIHFNGTIRFRMIDSTVTTADIGEIAHRVKALAAQSGRRVCFGQYHDFSEDLDPILGAPHPMMTYRKVANLRAFNPESSMTEWGVLSPDIAACRVNQDVLRETIWGAETTCFEELLPLLFPADLPEAARKLVGEAWRKVDYALQIWPQFWGMRFQGCGVRQRWLVKPLLPPFMKLPEDYYNRLVDQQLYRYHAKNIFREFMNLTDSQAIEVAKVYSDMIGLVREAEVLFEKAAGAAGPHGRWIENQLASARWMRIFWTSFRNQFIFHANAPEDHLTADQRHWIEDEIQNTKDAITHLAQYPKSLVIAAAPWPQCFGPELPEDFRLKLAFLESLRKV